MRARYTGTLHDFPAACRSRDEVLDEWVHLRGEVDRRQFAERMGMTYAAFERMWWRARADGDERARL